MATKKTPDSTSERYTTSRNKNTDGKHDIRGHNNKSRTGRNQHLSVSTLNY